MYNLVEYSDNYSKTSASLWQYSREKPAVSNDAAVIALNVANVTNLLDFKEKITGQTDNNGKKNVEIIIPLKYLSSYRKHLECI